MQSAKKPNPLRRTPAQVRGERRIEMVLDAAAQLFDEVSYESATTILIAQRANTAVGSLYDFFPNKEAIARALVERFTAELRALLDGAMTDDVAQLPLDQALTQLIDPLVQWIHTQPGFRALYLKAPQVGQLSQGHQSLEHLITQRIATLLRLRYPRSKPSEVARISRICLEVVKALTALAIQDKKINRKVITDLKVLLRAYIEKSLAMKCLQRSGHRW
jgi:AcrR family transcriptional regulator